MAQMYLATVHILVDAENSTDAADCIHETLELAGEFGSVVDWGYIQSKKDGTYPPPRRVNVPGDYTEGQMYELFQLPQRED